MKFNFYVILFLLMLMAACKQPSGNLIVGIDVSASARDSFKTIRPKVESFVISENSSNLNLCIFAHDAYEVYNGPKPGKDRDIVKLIDLCVSKIQEIPNVKGTDFVNILNFLSHKVNSFTEAVIYTDGFFEFTDEKTYNISERLEALHKNGLYKIYFYGVNIQNKEKLYNWFKSAHIIIYFD